MTFWKSNKTKSIDSVNENDHYKKNFSAEFLTSD